MLEKIFYYIFLSYLFNMFVIVNYWDGSSEIYGEGILEVMVIFKEVILMCEIIKNVLIVFGEVYMDGKIEIDGSI